ncbi:MAG: hypothetical protein V8R01_03665 [Bacilli bacterium]
MKVYQMFLNNAALGQLEELDNGNTVNSLVSELSGVQGNLQQIHSILSNINWNLPYSFQYQYRQAIVNIINGCSRNQNTISDIKGLYSSVSGNSKTVYRLCKVVAHLMQLII